MTGPFRLGGALRREHRGSCSEASGPSGTHLRREEGRQLLPCRLRQAFAKASRGGEPGRVPAPQNQQLLPRAGRYTDRMDPHFHFLLGVAVLWKPAGLSPCLPGTGHRVWQLRRAEWVVSIDHSKEPAVPGAA